ncbi:alpha-galactosidase [Actinomadura spongiicola]|uniref:Alpha-galactosidase n=1 Tax=Actinomadura spongiicola TaxID=2303421 RepID=A0A372G974_9ACTN|nr:alpha-galactosidase [Actinomadura spongiicola]RFS81954.1 alpha-galactosidase [Actinomadura spongiicola]
MTKIAMIGAGGQEFPLRLMTDFLALESPREAAYTLMDIDPVPLARTERLVRRVASAHGYKIELETTTDRRAALDGADFVIVCFQVGSQSAYTLDMEIPRRYGIDQTVGDTLGPGGAMRGLRTMAVLDGLADDVLELCPDALVLQYANPMSINCAYLQSRGVKAVGLCHSVHHTAGQLADIMGLAPGTWSFRAAGINHQAWMLEFKHEGRSILPRLYDTMLAYSRGEHDPVVEIDEWYAGGRERVRTEVMKLTGYFPTESSHHVSEYFPHFRRSPELIAELLPERWDYHAIGSGQGDAEQEALADELAAEPLTLSGEYAAGIVDSILTGTPRVIYGNVPNDGLITNLPAGACVEVPCLVDASGVQPTRVGDLPAACAAVNLPSIAFQSCVVEAYRTRSRRLVNTALTLDRLTAALLPLPDIQALTDELLDEQARWLPAFHDSDGKGDRR